MHAIVGVAIGLVLGYLFTHGRGGRAWLRPGCLSQFICGVGLVGGGVGSIFGDTIWLQLEYRIFPPDKVQTGFGGKTASVAAIVLGVGLALASLLRQFYR